LPRWIGPVFFASGAAALIYQVVWQRALFTLFGVDIASVTVVVTAFMVGLGLGSLLGGWVSARQRWDALKLFGLAEGVIGGFGLVSLDLFAWVGQATLGSSLQTTAAVAFLLLLVPTALMGATLPLLVGHAARGMSSVGDLVGRLYSVNALGSALASLLCATVLLATLGKSGTVCVAASVNLVVAVWVLTRPSGRP
jgi:predicted membrane-bound spermidine synthase